MSWSTHAKQIARTPCYVVEVDLDWYDDVGVTATNTDGTLCYRTPETTLQAGPFALGHKTRRFMTNTQRAIPELGAIPCVAACKIQAEEIRVGRGLGFFGQASIMLSDFVDDDRREDPFYADASRAAVDHGAGTFFGKLIARNPFWTKRAIRIIEGWTTDGVWHADDAITHNFQVRDIQGPVGGTVTITAAGPLQLLNLEDQEIPAASPGALAANIAIGATTATISPADLATEYPASGMVRIGDECMTYTRVGAVLTLTRAQLNTIAAAHSAGDSIQLCTTYTNQRVIDILQDVLVTYGGVDASLLNLTEWEEEMATWLSLYILSGAITKPNKVLDVVQELLQASATLIWWDDAKNKVRLRAIRPALSVAGTWTDRFHAMKPVSVKRDMGERVSRTDALIDIRSGDKDPKDAASYRIRVVGDPQGEGETEHGSSQVALTFTRWINASQIGLAVRNCAQSTMILRDGRQTYTVEVAAKDSARTIGDVLDLLTREIVDRSGQPIKTRVIVTKREPIVAGSTYRYTLERVPFDGRFAFYTDSDVPGYDAAADWQRDPGGFYSNAAGDDFGPNDPAYLYG